jgi:hypothetical protein
MEGLAEARWVSDTGVHPLILKSIEVCLPRLMVHVKAYPGMLSDVACISSALARCEWLLERLDRLTSGEADSP